ncbi:glyoxylase-like metal-dependent hydrolase (beta-lactamase superfamily II), partial [Kribbella orskensis]
DSDQVRLTHVFETHIHNDYVTGGLALARATGARYLVNGDDAVSFDRTPIHDGETVAVGQRIRVRAIHTPGHTFTHLSYALTDAGRGNEPIGVFTGGSLLYGATGRPDLLGTENTDKLVRHQHASAHRLAGGLPNATGVYPTHGFGSFCSATQTNATESTIGQERRTNPVLTQDEETYVRELLDGLGAWPAYYIHMGRTNAAGPAAPDPVPTRARRGVGARRRRLPRSPRRSSTPPNARPSRSTTTSRTPSKPDSSCCDPRPDQLRQALNGP